MSNRSCRFGDSIALVEKPWLLHPNRHTLVITFLESFQSSLKNLHHEYYGKQPFIQAGSSDSDM